MKRTISLVLVLALGLTAEVANADFTFGEPTMLGPNVNTSGSEGTPNTTGDGLELYFEYRGTGSYGNGDIYVSRRATKGDLWGQAVNLGPSVNSSAHEFAPSLSSDGLMLYFTSNQSGGDDIWLTTRTTRDDPWSTPVILGPPVNVKAHEFAPCISADGLSLYFTSQRSGGFGGDDLWVTARTNTDDPWTTPVNLGPTINSSRHEAFPNISVDGRLLLFCDYMGGPFRPGGQGGQDIWFATRATIENPWGEPVNVGPNVNSSRFDFSPHISADGSTLYFASDRSGATLFENVDIWQAPVIPIVDLNRDGIVDSADMCIIVDHWGTDEPLCDIGPMPWGDGIVDVQDLIVLAEHLFEGIPPVESEEVNVDEEDDGSQVELEQGQILVVTLESNPTTGYSWEVIETQESILEQMGEVEFKQSDTGGPPLVGAGGWEIVRFKAIGAGEMTLQLVYRRPWEEGVEPIKTFSIKVVVN